MLQPWTVILIWLISTAYFWHKDIMRSFWQMAGWGWVLLALNYALGYLLKIRPLWF